MTQENQERWNSYGSELREKILATPAEHQITDKNFERNDFFFQLKTALQPMTGKKILEVGCGRGEFAVWMAKQGADVTAIDVGDQLIGAAEALAQVNDVTCHFQTASILDLNFPDAHFDTIVGLNILHHLPSNKVAAALRECHRVLKKNGNAYFYEPIENSKAFDTVQNMFSLKKPGEKGYRPSILSRKKWKEHVANMDDRPMTTKELIFASYGIFKITDIRYYGLLIRLARLTNRKFRDPLRKMDRTLLKTIPPIRYFCQKNLITYTKV